MAIDKHCEFPVTCVGGSEGILRSRPGNIPFRRDVFYFDHVTRLIVCVQNGLVAILSGLRSVYLMHTQISYRCPSTKRTTKHTHSNPPTLLADPDQCARRSCVRSNPNTNITPNNYRPLVRVRIVVLWSASACA